MSRSSDYLDGYYAELARQVSKALGGDRARKQRILEGSPHLAYSLDAAELEAMSSGELARRELKGYGIKVSDSSDPLEVREAFHAGRLQERQRAAGVRPAAMDGSKTPNFLDAYLKE